MVFFTGHEILPSPLGFLSGSGRLLEDAIAISASKGGGCDHLFHCVVTCPALATE